MDAGSPSPDLTALYVSEFSVLLPSVVFLFLWRQSRVVYFGLWAVAWLLQLPAQAFGFQWARTGHAGWLAPHAVFEFAFVIVLIGAARAGFASDVKEWRKVLRLAAALPVVAALAYAMGTYAIGRFGSLTAYHTSIALIVAFGYLYNFLTLRQHHGFGSHIFRWTLLALALAPVWQYYAHGAAYLNLILHSILAFGAMAMWSESQTDRIRNLAAELDHTRRDARNRLDVDRLTGLLNQAAMARRVDEPGEFGGVVAVCDMDNFKEINDRYGHLVGDDILRNIGHLLQGSIRQEDEAFRWGGDEFVILFHNQRADVARNRMTEIENRLRDFQVRGHGVLPISFSWGTAEAYGRTLRDALDEADRSMYEFKRKRAEERERPRTQ